MFKIHFVQHVGMQIINTYFSQDSDSYANYKRYPKFSAQGPVHIHKHTYRHKINWITFDVTCKEDLIKNKKKEAFSGQEPTQFYADFRRQNSLQHYDLYYW